MRNPSPPVKLAQAGEPGSRPGNGAAPNTPYPVSGRFFMGQRFLGCGGMCRNRTLAFFSKVGIPTSVLNDVFLTQI